MSLQHGRTSKGPAIRLGRRNPGNSTDAFLCLDKMHAEGIQACAKLLLDSCSNTGRHITFERFTNWHPVQFASNPNSFSNWSSVVSKQMQLIVERRQILGHLGRIREHLVVKQEIQVSAGRQVRIGHPSPPGSEDVTQLQCYPPCPRPLSPLFFPSLLGSEIERNDYRGTRPQCRSPSGCLGGPHAWYPDDAHRRKGTQSRGHKSQQTTMNLPIGKTKVPAHSLIPLWIGRHFAMAARKPLAARPQGVK